MTIWFVSRHPGALEWAQLHGIAFDRHVPHLNLAEVAAGDTVIGSLPISLAAAVCSRGAAFWSLSLNLSPRDRGRELSAEELTACNATLERYDIRKLP